MEETKQNFQTPPCLLIPLTSLLKVSLSPGEVLVVVHSLVLYICYYPNPDVQHQHEDKFVL